MFKRITTYRDSEARTQRENQVTEALAVLLEEVDGLGFYIAQHWLGEPDEEIEASLPGGGEGIRSAGDWGPLEERHKDSELKVATQVTVWSSESDRHGFVDLELRFRAAEGSDRVVRVEVKHESQPHSGQLALYLEEHAAVVLLAPLVRFKDFPKDQMRHDVANRSWQRTAERIASFPRDHQVGEVEQWLIKQFTQFLREEKLMSPEAVGPQHLFAMANHKEAREVLESLNEIANRRIGNGWGAMHDVGRADQGYTSYSRYNREGGAESQWNDDAWFEFKASEKDFDGSAEELHFIAGLSWDSKRFKPPRESWSTLMTGPDRFQEFDEDGCPRFMRVSTPLEVLSGATLEAQGQALGDWVIDSFKRLSGVGSETSD